MDRFVILHGTTAANAAAIRASGFRPSDPKAVAKLVEEHYGLPDDSIYLHECYSFARTRMDLDRIHFTTNPGTAKHYSLPEQFQDALGAAYRIMFPPGDDELAKDYNARLRPWLDEEAPKVAGPGVTLEIEVPWAVIGENAFGRIVSRELFDEKLDGVLPETLSLPVAVLAEARIV